MNRVAICSVLLAACSSASGSSTGAGTDGGSPADAAPDVAAGSVLEHGQIVDYFSLKPIAGLTVTDNNVSATTDANGQWSLTVPASSVMQPSVTGPMYTQLLFPDSTPTGVDANFGTAVMADSSSFNLEENSLTGFDPAKALVQIVLVLTGSCTSAVGGTAKVVSPAGASLTYFATSGVPMDSVTTFQDVKPNRPVVVVYNLTPGADLTVQIDHPTCKALAFPATSGHGVMLTGKVRTRAAEPGGYNAALVVLLQ